MTDIDLDKEFYNPNRPVASFPSDRYDYPYRFIVSNYVEIFYMIQYHK